MARDPAQRYADMTAMRDDLRAYLEGRVVRAHESGALAELRKWIGRNRILSATAAAGILALAVGFATSSSLYVRAAEESERANAKAEEVLRLSDLQELDDLTAEADASWPVLPESAPALGRWLDRAHRLLAALPEHERKLAALGTSTGEEDRWWRNQLTKLVQGLKALADPETGLIAGLSAEHGWGMQQRLEFARSIRERSVDGPAAAERWREARASIRDRTQCPHYDGLELAPQIGLLPIGRDPCSGLWEFAHLESGEPAGRGADGRLVLEDDTGIVLVLVPGGKFWMGEQGEDPAARNYVPWGAGEEPNVHEVSLEPFFLSKYEMTQGQWSRFAGHDPSEFFGEPWSPLLPVEQVNWYACVELTRRLGLLLPTEAQWEFAARAGTDTPWWTGSQRESLAGAANLGDGAWKRAYGSIDPFDPSREQGRHEEWLEDEQSSTSVVGSYAPNPFGLFDVAGNVFEWSRDEAANYAVGHREGDGELKGEHRENRARILRGGSWQTDSRSAGSATRGLARPEAISWDVGLRPARAIERD
jgi:formylglycine-generating enzyme required for sulfatase activity